MSELLPCPFCGAEPWVSVGRQFVHPDNACILRGCGFVDEYRERWNTRTPRILPELFDDKSEPLI